MFYVTLTHTETFDLSFLKSTLGIWDGSRSKKVGSSENNRVLRKTATLLNSTANQLQKSTMLSNLMDVPMKTMVLVHPKQLFLRLKKGTRFFPWKRIMMKRFALLVGRKRRCHFCQAAVINIQKLEDKLAAIRCTNGVRIFISKMNVIRIIYHISAPCMEGRCRKKPLEKHPKKNKHWLKFASS